MGQPSQFDETLASNVTRFFNKSTKSPAAGRAQPPISPVITCAAKRKLACAVPVLHPKHLGTRISSPPAPPSYTANHQPPEPHGASDKARLPHQHQAQLSPLLPHRVPQRPLSCLELQHLTPQRPLAPHCHRRALRRRHCKLQPLLLPACHHRPPSISCLTSTSSSSALLMPRPPTHPHSQLLQMAPSRSSMYLLRRLTSG